MSNLKKFTLFVLIGIFLFDPFASFATNTATKNLFSKNNNTLNSDEIVPNGNRYYYKVRTTSEKYLGSIYISEKDIKNGNLTNLIASSLIGLLGTPLSGITSFAYGLGNHFYNESVPGRIYTYRSITYKEKIDNIRGTSRVVGETWNLRTVSVTNEGKRSTKRTTLKIK